MRTFAAVTPDDVVTAAATGRAAQAAWAARAPASRASVLLRVHDLLLARQEQALDLIQLETGKARRHAFEEVADAANVLRYYAVRAPGWLAPSRRRGAIPLLTKTTREISPAGLVAVIVPWNYPLNLFITDITPALVSGNAVVAMPDQQTSFTALWALAIWREAGVPDEILQVVTGPGAELGPVLIGQADAVLFTGSTPTGRIVAAQAGARLVPASVELGGKNALLVLDDADLDAAADGIVRGCFVGAGQVCLSYERLYVDRRVYEALVPRLVERTRALRLSCSFDWDVEVGTLGSARQLARVRAHVDDAVAKGARVLVGGTTAARHRPFRVRADAAVRRHAGDDAVGRGDVRSRRGRLRRRQRRRGGRSRQRLGVRSDRERVVSRCRARPTRGAPAGRRLGEHQRGVCRRVGIGRQPQQRLEGVGPWPSPRAARVRRRHPHEDDRGPAPGAPGGAPRRRACNVSARADRACCG